MASVLCHLIPPKLLPMRTCQHLQPSPKLIHSISNDSPLRMATLVIRHVGLQFPSLPHVDVDTQCPIPSEEIIPSMDADLSVDLDNSGLVLQIQYWTICTCTAVALFGISCLILSKLSSYPKPNVVLKNPIFEDEEADGKSDPVPFYCAAIGLSIALGTFILLPFTIIANCLLQLSSEYKIFTDLASPWLTVDLIYGMWEMAFWSHLLCIFVIIPFGLAWLQAVGGRLIRLMETMWILITSVILIWILQFLLHLVVGHHHSPLSNCIHYSFPLLSFIGGILILGIAPKGHLRMLQTIQRLYTPLGGSADDILACQLELNRLSNKLREIRQKLFIQIVNNDEATKLMASANIHSLDELSKWTPQQLHNQLEQTLYDRDFPLTAYPSFTMTNDYTCAMSSMTSITRSFSFDRQDSLSPSPSPSPPPAVMVDLGPRTTTETFSIASGASSPTTSSPGGSFRWPGSGRGSGKRARGADGGGGMSKIKTKSSSSFVHFSFHRAISTVFHRRWSTSIVASPSARQRLQHIMGYSSAVELRTDLCRMVTEAQQLLSAQNQFLGFDPSTTILPSQFQPSFQTSPNPASSCSPSTQPPSSPSPGLSPSRTLPRKFSSYAAHKTAGSNNSNDRIYAMEHQHLSSSGKDQDVLDQLRREHRNLQSLQLRQGRYFIVYNLLFLLLLSIYLFLSVLLLTSASDGTLALVGIHSFRSPRIFLHEHLDGRPVVHLLSAIHEFITVIFGGMALGVGLATYVPLLKSENDSIQLPAILIFVLVLVVISAASPCVAYLLGITGIDLMGHYPQTAFLSSDVAIRTYSILYMASTLCQMRPFRRARFSSDNHVDEPLTHLGSLHPTYYDDPTPNDDHGEDGEAFSDDEGSLPRCDLPNGLAEPNDFEYGQP